jgi:hypothetical protein
MKFRLRLFSHKFANISGPLLCQTITACCILQAFSSTNSYIYLLSNCTLTLLLAINNQTPCCPIASLTSTTSSLPIKLISNLQQQNSIKPSEHQHHLHFVYCLSLICNFLNCYFLIWLQSSTATSELTLLPLQEPNKGLPSVELH